MKATRLETVLLSLALALLCACSESVRIRSGPSGATVYVDQTRAGMTPLNYALPRSQLDEPHQVRIEKEGYEPVVTELHTRLAKGRVTGAVFTLGILAIFRSMYYVEPVFAELQRAAPPQAVRDRDLSESLRTLHELHQKGQISDEELQRWQQELLRPK